MSISPEKKQALLIVYDKLIIGLLVAAVSAVLLYSYNVYSKAFELAQTHSRSYSTVASRLRDLVIDNSLKVRREARSAYLQGQTSLTKAQTGEIDSLAVEIEDVAILLPKQVASTSEAAKDLSKQLKVASIKFASKDSFTKKSVDEFDAQMTSTQNNFLKNYDTEIGQLAAEEFQKYFDIYQQALPFYMRSGPVLTIAILTFVTFTVLLLGVL
jgi:hypothetical protein